MKEKDFKALTKLQMLEILFQQEKELEELRDELSKPRLNPGTKLLDEIMQATQEAADSYLQNIRGSGDNAYDNVTGNDVYDIPDYEGAKHIIEDSQGRIVELELRIADSERRFADSERRAEDSERRAEDSKRRAEDSERHFADWERRIEESERRFEELEQFSAGAYNVVAEKVTELDNIFTWLMELIESLHLELREKISGSSLSGFLREKKQDD